LVAKRIVWLAGRISWVPPFSRTSNLVASRFNNLIEERSEEFGYVILRSTDFFKKIADKLVVRRRAAVFKLTFAVHPPAAMRTYDGNPRKNSLRSSPT
jgi:hypothetical protein